MNATLLESAIRILRDHVGDGDRFLRMTTQRLISTDLRHLTDEQRHERAVMEARMRADRLKGPPTIFQDTSFGAL